LLTNEQNYLNQMKKSSVKLLSYSVHDKV